MSDSSPPFRKTLHRWWRSVRGKDVFARPEVKVPLLHLGEGFGRWAIAERGLSAETVVWTVGIGRDIDFERALIDRFGCHVHAFDPTPLALAWVAEQALPPQFVVHPLGLADYDGVATFAPPREAGLESFSMARSDGVGEATRAEVRTYATLLDHVGQPPDVLKVDIEGSEYAVLPSALDTMSQRASWPAQILIEFHQRWKHDGAPKPRDTKAALASLREAGYRIAHVAAGGCEYTFVRADFA